MLVSAMALAAAFMAAGDGRIAEEDPPVPQTEGQRGDIVVIGQKQPEIDGGQVSRGATLGAFGDRDLYDTPVSVKSFTSEYIADQIALISNEIVSRDASFVSTNATSINGAGAGRLRGFRMEPFESSYDGFSTVATRRYPLELLERVDILKGPTAVFTGIVGGVGGTINYVSKKPLDAPLTRVTGLYSSGSQFGGLADVSRRFGADDQFGLRANLSYRDGETAIDGIDEDARVMHLAANWRRGPVSVDVQYGNFYNRMRGGSGGYFYQAGVPIGDAPEGDRVSGPRWDDREQHDQFVRAVVDVALAKGWSAFAVGGLVRSQERYVGVFVNVADVAGNGTAGAFAQEGEVDWGDGYNIDLGVRGAFDTGGIGHRLTAAYSHVRSKPEYSDLSIAPDFGEAAIDIYDPASFERPAPTLTGTGRFFRLSDTKTEGLVLSDELALFDERLLLTAAVRYTRLSIDSFNYGAPSPDGPTQSYRADDWSPGFAALFKLTPAVSIYANYLRAVEAGSVAPIQAANRGEVIAPGVSRQYEAGIKADLGNAGVTAAIFDIERPSAYVDPVTLIYDSFGNQRHRGLELDVFGSPLPGLRLLASYTYLDARLLENADPAVNGNRPISVPDHVAVVSADADVPGLVGAAVNAAVRHTARQFYDTANLRSIPDFTVVDLGARYRFDLGTTALTARVAVTNLFDRDFFQSTDFTVQPGAPRTVRASLSAAF